MSYYVYRYIIKPSEESWDEFKHGIVNKLQDNVSSPQDDLDVETVPAYDQYVERISNCPVTIPQTVLDSINENTKRISFAFETIEDARAFYQWRTAWAENKSDFVYNHEIRDEEGNLVSPN